jgi:hypothetical protein
MTSKMYRSSLYGLMTLVLVAAVGCSAGDQPASSNNVTESPTEQSSEPNMPKQSKELAVQTSSGDTKVSLKPMDNGAELVDANGQTLAVYTLNTEGETRKVEIKNASGQVTGYVKIEGRRYTVEDSAQQPLYSLRAGGEQRHRFVDASDENVYVLRVNDNNRYTIRNADSEVVHRVRGGGKQAVLQNAEKETVLQAQAMSPLALASFSFDELTQEQQGALAYAVNLRSERDARAAKRAEKEEGDNAAKARNQQAEEDSAAE